MLASGFLFMYGRWDLHKLIAIHYINKLPQTSLPRLLQL